MNTLIIPLLDTNENTIDNNFRVNPAVFLSVSSAILLRESHYGSYLAVYLKVGSSSGAPDVSKLMLLLQIVS